MTVEELLNKLAGEFSAENVSEYRGLAVVKSGILRYYVRDAGDVYRVGVYLPVWVRVLLMALSFIVGLQVSENRWIQMLTVIVLFLGLHYLIILLAGKDRKQIYSRIEALLDKPVKVSKL